MNENLDILRHSTSHLMAQAVKDLFPGVKVAIGPSIENGFYYDFDYDPGFTEEDLEKIEKRMKEIVAANVPIECKVMKRDEAIEYFTKMGETYKVELLKDITRCRSQHLYPGVLHGPMQRTSPALNGEDKGF